MPLPSKIEFAVMTPPLRLPRVVSASSGAYPPSADADS